MLDLGEAFLIKTVWRRYIIYNVSREETKGSCSFAAIQTLGGIEWVRNCGF